MHDLVIRGGTVVDGTGASAVTADVAVVDGTIVAVGRVAGPARREIDADGLVVAPGWVDIHTHYDGQARWDPDLTPSSWHGVTTAVMGNCGVGFAPVRPDGQDFLVELMEAVEDIPGIALTEGLDWAWESFPEYLDALDRVPRSVEVATQVPHIALRAYVMGERAHDDVATPDDIAEMNRLAREALEAGAAGISTSRTVLHSSRHGVVPGTHATAEELLGLGQAIREAGHGLFQLTTDHKGDPEDRAWMLEFVEQTGATISYLLSQSPKHPRAYQASLEYATEDLAAGRPIVPQVGCRPVSMLFGLQSSLHPFVAHRTWNMLEHLSHEERVAELRRPEVRERLLAESTDRNDPRVKELANRGSWHRWDQIFPLGDPPEYEPLPDTSVEAVAAREGRAPEAVAYDWLLEREGTALLYAPMANYADGNQDAIHEMMNHPGTVLGLSDAGAHCAVICDASMPTYLLTHWVKGRTRGPRLSLEQAVHLQTGRTAGTWGFTDRGVLAPGMRADLNLIDLDGLALRAPEMVFDLPAGGRRLVQRADGYVATFVAGVATWEHGEPTLERPAGLVRFGRNAAAS